MDPAHSKMERAGLLAYQVTQTYYTSIHEKQTSLGTALLGGQAWTALNGSPALRTAAMTATRQRQLNGN